MPARYPPDDPREWLSRARSDTVLAKAESPGVYFEDLRFHAQQAAEKAVKGLLIQHGVDFPCVHDLAQLLTLLQQAGEQVPERVQRASGLTRFAVFTRYPGVARPISREESEQALSIAEGVVHRVEKHLQSGELRPPRAP